MLMAYRKKVNTNTGFSPFRLVFGRKMNQLKDWTVTPDDDEAASILARADELRHHSESTIPTALKNINKSQSRQRTRQNRDMNVEESSTYWEQSIRED